MGDEYKKETAMKEKYPYTVRSFFVSTWALPAATLFFSAFQWLYGRTSVLSLEGLQQGHTPGDVVPHQPLTLIYHPLNTHTHTHIQCKVPWVLMPGNEPATDDGSLR